MFQQWLLLMAACLRHFLSFRIVDHSMLWVIGYESYHMSHMAWPVFSSNKFFNRSKRDSDYGSYSAPEVMKVKRSGIDRRSADRRKLRKYLSKIQRLQGKYKCYIWKFWISLSLITLCLRWPLETLLLKQVAAIIAVKHALHVIFPYLSNALKDISYASYPRV